MGNCLKSKEDPSAFRKIDDPPKDNQKAALSKVESKDYGGVDDKAPLISTTPSSSVSLHIKPTPPVTPSTVPSATSAIPAQPSKADLDKRFESFLEENLFKPDVREKMRKLPDGTKWILLFQGSQQQMEKDLNKKKTEEIGYWIELLDKHPDKVTPKDLDTLRVVMRGQNKKWMVSFVDEGCLKSLLSIISKQEHPWIEGLLCLKSFMNNEFGLNVILTTPAAVDQIALILIWGTDEMRIEVLELLSVISWISDKGHKSVIQALKNPLFPVQFEILLKILTMGEDVEVKTRCLTFINALINSVDILEDRVALRQQLIQLNILEAIEQLRSWVDKQRGKQFERFSRLIAQCDVFTEEWKRDKSETMKDKLDLADVEDVFKYLKDQVIQDGLGLHLLSVLQHLLNIPHDRDLSDAMWQNIDFIVRYAVNVKEVTEAPTVPLNKRRSQVGSIADQSQLQGLAQAIAEEKDKKDKEGLNRANTEAEAVPGVLSYAELKRLLAQREKEEVKVAGSNVLQETVEQQRRELHELQMKIAALEDQNKKLQSIPRAPSTALPRAPSSVSTLPRVPTSPPMDAPPMDAPPMDGPPDAPPMDGPPPFDAPPMDGPPMAPDMDGPPPPPDGIPGAPSVASGPKLPPKRVIKPTVKLKAFHWSIVPTRQVAGTVWGQLKDDDIKLENKEFESMFALKVSSGPDSSSAPNTPNATPTKENKSGDLKSPKAKKKEVVELVDGKRANNIGIALASFRGMSFEAIRDALLAMDEKILTDQKLSVLMKSIPTMEELDTVMHYEGDVTRLGTTEKFFRAIGGIPRLERRVEVFVFKTRWDNLYQENSNIVKLCLEANTALKNSPNLMRLLEIILSLGNYLNGGTPKGAQYGFKLETLGKLTILKGSDGITTFLQYIVEFVQKKYPQVRNFLEDLKSVPEASKIEFNSLKADIGRLVGQMRIAASELKTAETNDHQKDRFFPVVNEWYQRAGVQCQELETQLKELEVTGQKLNAFYAQDESSSIDDLYKLWTTFVNEYKLAETAVQQKKEKEEREKKRAMTTKSTPIRSSVGTIDEKGRDDRKETVVDQKEEELGGGQVDAVMNRLNKSNAQDIMKAIRDRRKKVATPKIIPTTSSFGASAGPGVMGKPLVSKLVKINSVDS